LIFRLTKWKQHNNADRAVFDDGVFKEAIFLERLPSSRGCFVCGKENPVGLRVHFDRTDDGVRAGVRPSQHFQGFGGVLQGGVAAGLMDDAMWYAIYGTADTMTMTVELTVRYKAPVPVETDLTVTARVVEQRRVLFTCAAAISGPDGTVLAEATGKFMTAPKALAEQLKKEMT
jgi:acyl-coenzyme A thioesterase PaaI-like protein